MSMFMQPQVVYEDEWIEYELWGELFFSPANIEGTLPDDVKIIARHSGYAGRLSAPGYTDCTEWGSPYADKKMAMQELYDSYGDDMTFGAFFNDGRPVSTPIIEHVEGFNGFYLYGRDPYNAECFLIAQIGSSPLDDNWEEWGKGVHLIDLEGEHNWLLHDLTSAYKFDVINIKEAAKEMQND